MGEPYRDAGGMECPRCKAMMTMQDDAGFACASGCGAWIPNAVITRLLGTVDLKRRGIAAQFFKVLGLPTTKCLYCATQLTAVYRTAGNDYVTLGQCDDHGVWCEQRARADFELAFRHEITNHHEIEVLADALGGDARELARHVLKLERQVVTLTQRLEALERAR